MTTSKNIFTFLSLLFCTIFNVNAQQEITLSNSSFEDVFLDNAGKPTCCIGVNGWWSCGKPDLNTPDSQPGNFGVNLPAASGNYYIGMVTRDNDTQEAISQRVRSPLLKGSCYSFSLKLSHSDILTSQSRKTGRMVRYDKPVVVKIWGGNGYCQKVQLLDKTSPIDHTYWKQYNFRLEPRSDFNYITIEVYYKTPTPITYNGNVLVDDVSAITLIPCDEAEEPPIVDITEPDVPVNISPSNPKPDPKPKPSEPIAEVKPPKTPTPPKNEKKILNLDRKKMVKGQVIRIEKLYFQADSATIKNDAFPVLDEIYSFLRYNSDISIEIGGHTNDRCATRFCDELSEKRAEAVAKYLIEKGIRRNRLLFKGYGKRNPVASNNSSKGRKQNQRVEIKILSLDG